MKNYHVTLIHVSMYPGGTYHDPVTVNHHRTAKGVVSDMTTTTLQCAPFCEHVFQVRMRTSRERWQLRLRYLLQAAGSIAAGAASAILGGITGLTFIIVVTALLSLAAYVTGLVFLCRIFARSTRYILTRADGQKVQATDHKIVFES